MLQGAAVITGANGDRFEFNYVDNLVEGQAFYYKAGGNDIWEERRYSRGLAQGAATLHLPGGDVEERTYEGGVLHGTATFVSHKGDREERCYVNGRLDGPAKYYYPSGAVETRIYENGVLQGEEEFFYSSFTLFNTVSIYIVLYYI